MFQARRANYAMMIERGNEGKITLFAEGYGRRDVKHIPLRAVDGLLLEHRGPDRLLTCGVKVCVCVCVCG